MNQEDMSEYIYTLEELAAQIGVSPSRVRQLVGQGRIEGAKMRAGSWFFTKHSAQSYERRSSGRPKTKVSADQSQSVEA